MEKVTNNVLTIIPKPHVHPHTMKKTYPSSVQNCKRSCAHKRYLLWVKNDYVHNAEKVAKNVLTILPKPHAHPHTMKKTHAKFQNNPYKTVRGVALTRGTHCLYIEVKNDKVHNVEKVRKNNLTIISKPHAHLHAMMKTHTKFQNDRYKTARLTCTETCTLKQVRQKMKNSVKSKCISSDHD